MLEKIYSFTSRIKYIRLCDYIAILKFFCAWPLAILFRLFHRELWLVCEDAKEARDNGYWFYRYMREKHPEKEVVYAIDKSSPDYFKVKKLGKVISYGSLEHWIYYLAAKMNISSQKGGKPNAAVCYFLEIYGLRENKRVFLQHGITINNAEWLYYDVTKFSGFICGAKLEFDFVNEKFGYPDNVVKYTGFARHDQLHDIAIKKNRILIMPTWREWLVDNVRSYDANEELNKSFTETEYFKRWNGFINDRDFIKTVKQYNLEVIFFPHRNMQRFISEFGVNDRYIEVADWKHWDVQDLLKTSSLLITDYSSVFFDFVYMKKPVIFYQFDEAMFRKHQYKKGWFDYANNGFGNVCKDISSVLKEINQYIEDDCKVNSSFLNEHKKCFPMYDNLNCQRIFEMIEKING